MHCSKGNPLSEMKCSGGNVILSGIFHVVSCFPLQFMLYLWNLDCFSKSVGTWSSFSSVPIGPYFHHSSHWYSFLTPSYYWSSFLTPCSYLSSLLLLDPIGPAFLLPIPIGPAFWLLSPIGSDFWLHAPIGPAFDSLLSLEQLCGFLLPLVSFLTSYSYWSSILRCSHLPIFDCIPIGWYLVVY